MTKIWLVLQGTVSRNVDGERVVVKLEVIARCAYEVQAERIAESLRSTHAVAARPTRVTARGSTVEDANEHSFVVAEMSSLLEGVR